jgi:hypothetical protein
MESMDNNDYIIREKLLIKNYIKESLEILYCNDDINMLCILINRLQNYSHMYSIIQKEIVKNNIIKSIIKLIEIDYNNIDHILNNVEISNFIIQNINLQYEPHNDCIFKTVFYYYHTNFYKNKYKLIDFLIENGIDKKIILDSIELDGMPDDTIKILMYINKKLYIKDMIKDYHLLYWYFNCGNKQLFKECKFIYDNTIDINYQTAYQNMLYEMIHLLHINKFKIVKYLIDNGLKFLRPTYNSFVLLYDIILITLKMYKFIVKYNMVDKYIIFKDIDKQYPRYRYEENISFLEPKLIKYLIFKEDANINKIRNTKYYKQQKIYRNSKYRSLFI